MDKAMYSDIMTCGFWMVSTPDPYFSSKGCDNPACKTAGLGAKVYDVRGYRSLSEKRDNYADYHEFRLCEECLNSEAKGEIP